ncbi:MAG: TIR domain-containing protein [Acidobacteria bacterium]|nr:TIR domain-containing protein [Acidobacteriota bacterium]
MPKVFISYNRADLKHALALEQAMQSHAVSVWRDQHSLYGGQQWPKTIGEALADCDAVLLLWSANATAGHYVEFEWNTALALKKKIIPLLLDDATLPPALTAINAIPHRDPDETVAQILMALPIQPQMQETERRERVIKQLQCITASEPAEALAQAKALFSQSNINVGGHLIQGGDVNVTLGESRQLFPTVVAALVVIVIVVVASFYFTSSSRRALSQAAASPTVEEMTYLRGQVENAEGKPLDGATVRVDDIGKQPLETTTTSSGGFIIENIPARIGDRVRVYISKEGHETQNQYVALPGPLPTVRLKRK